MWAATGIITGNVGRYGVNAIRQIVKKDGVDVVVWSQTRRSAAELAQTQQHRQSELVQVFDPLNPRDGITVGNRSVLPKPDQAVPIYEGLSENEVKAYFRELAGVADLPVAKTIYAKDGKALGTIWTVSDGKGGSFSLRDFASSTDLSGPVWTIEVPKTMVPTVNTSGKSVEIKFIK